MSTSSVKASALAFAFIGGPLTPVSCILLTGAASGVTGSMFTKTDLSALEISTGGNYTAGTGVPMPDLADVYDSTTNVVEYSAGSTTWTSTSGLNYTVAYRTAVLCWGSSIFRVFDFGSTQTLTATPFTLTVAASPSVSGSWPVLRLLGE